MIEKKRIEHLSVSRSTGNPWTVQDFIDFAAELDTAIYNGMDPTTLVRILSDSVHLKEAVVTTRVTTPQQVLSKTYAKKRTTQLEAPIERANATKDDPEPIDGYGKAIKGKAPTEAAKVIHP